MSNLQEKANKLYPLKNIGGAAEFQQSAFINGYEMCQKEYEEKLNKFNETIMKIVGHGDPYPLEDVLKGLMWATDYLLVKKSYDGHNYEELEQAVRRAKEIIAILETRECHFL
jgi:hypothetical protein